MVNSEMNMNVAGVDAGLDVVAIGVGVPVTRCDLGKGAGTLATSLQALVRPQVVSLTRFWPRTKPVQSASEACTSKSRSSVAWLKSPTAWLK
jgi:hypothetical protein